MLKGAIRGQEGNVFILVLVLLVLGGLILTPLLGLMSTGLIAGQVYEKKTDELYAADAGVEDAIWRIQSNNLTFDSNNYSYLQPLTVNGKSVDVVVYREDLDPTACGTEFTYRVLSIAATNDSGGTAAIDSSTTVDAHLVVSYMDFSALLDNALVSNDTITIQPGTEINGDVWLPDEEDLDNKGSINGTVKDEEDVLITWPTFEQLSAYYWDDVKHLEPYPTGYVLNIPSGTTQDSPYVIGPLLAGGDLTIKGHGWIKLDGTIYAKGNLFTNPTPEIHIDLQGHTIFSECEIQLNPGVWLHGSGCIIARNDIDFQPNLDSEGENFILVLSLEGIVRFNPGTDFTGCIAGEAHVQMQPGNTINWISPEGKGLDVPWGADGDELPPVTGLNIVSWEIK